MNMRVFRTGLFLVFLFVFNMHLSALQIDKISRFPFVPKEGDKINIVAEVETQAQLKILKLFYRVGEGIYTTIPFDSNKTNFYYFHIPATLRNGENISYYVYAENILSDIVVSDTYRITVGEKSILFDYTKDETAGNADWVIDNNMPYPSPANPTSETGWIGAISSWAFELHQAGYNVVTLPPDSVITYGDSSRPLDLSNFNVYVICEPQDPFTYDERKAIFDFVRNGGGLFLVSDHYGADRNNNGWDATEIYNAMGIGDSMGIHFNSQNESNNDITEDSYNYNSSNSSDTIFHGPFGDITKALCYHSGTTMRVWGSAYGKVWKSSYSQGSTNGVMMALSSFHNGRVIGIGDSSPADDGTGNAGNNLYNGWSGEGDDRLFFLNGTYWLIANPNNGVVQNNDLTTNNAEVSLLTNILSKNETGTLMISNPERKNININLYNLAGIKIGNLYEGNGKGKIYFKISELHKGIYFIKCSGFTKTTKLVIID